MITRGEIAGKILRVLQKTPQYQGFYTDDRINDAIEDCMDLIATEMFLAGEGWQNKMRPLRMESGAFSVRLPPDVVLLNAVRYLTQGAYVPLVYSVPNNSVQMQPTSGLKVPYATTYRLIDNTLVFPQALTEGGDEALQIEYTSFPKRLQDDNDFIELQFAKPMSHYIKWRACSLLVSGVGKSNPEWLRQEIEWKILTQAIITKRNDQVQFIAEFAP